MCVCVCCIPRISFTMKAVAMGNLCLSQTFPSPCEKLPHTHIHTHKPKLYKQRCYVTSNKQPWNPDIKTGCSSSSLLYRPLSLCLSLPPPPLHKLCASLSLSSPHFPFILNSISYLGASPVNLAWLQKPHIYKLKHTPHPKAAPEPTPGAPLTSPLHTKQPPGHTVAAEASLLLYT